MTTHASEPGVWRSRDNVITAFCAVAVVLLGAVAPETSAAPTSQTLTSSLRTTETVMLSGSALPLLLGWPVESIGLFRYDDAAARFEPVPFQVDERFVKVFDPGLPTQFSELVYDVFGEEDGLFDADDEIAFLVGDGGARAPLDGSWVDGAEETRLEIVVTDPRPVNPEPPRWVYLYIGPGLPASPTTHVSWDGDASSSITTDLYRLDFAGNWITPGLTVHAPCGGGTDLLDRFKGRAEPGGVSRRQDEEDWNETSTYLGSRAGPVRAIRYVRGARSGVNTILRDVVEPNYWTRSISLRVHPVDAVWIYFDWLPQANATLFTPTHPGGLPVDGVPDAGVSRAFTAWHLVRTGSGGLFVSWNVPTSPLYGSREFFYVDDASHDDAVPPKTSYPDDDDSAYGAHGVRIWNTLDSSVTPIQLGFRAHPLCVGEGDFNLAVTLQELAATPPVPDAVPQSDCEAVRTVRVLREGSNLRLSWQGDPTADDFRVYVSTTPGLDRASWTFAGETVLPTFLDPGGATGADRYYSVVCTVDGAEGPW